MKIMRFLLVVALAGAAILPGLTCADVRASDGKEPHKSRSDVHLYMNKYCLKFKQTSDDYIVDLIEDMEHSPFNVEDLLAIPACQSEGYSNAVKSPMLHIVADDPNAREDFLQSFYRYFLIKRQNPELFTVSVNSKNTKGETLLDYFHSLNLNKTNQRPEQKAIVEDLIRFLCLHGGIYSHYRNLNCSQANGPEKNSSR